MPRFDVSYKTEGTVRVSAPDAAEAEYVTECMLQVVGGVQARGVVTQIAATEPKGDDIVLTPKPVVQTMKSTERPN